MRSLALFRPSFQRVQKVIEEVTRIKEGVFLTARKRIQFERISRTFEVVNSIQNNVTDLQSPFVEEQLAKIEQFLVQRQLSISYDYRGQGFAIRRGGALNERVHRFNMHLRSCPVEKVDSPDLRRTLYFHELKDLQKHFKVNYPKNAPKFIRDIYRKNVQNQVLDSRNPLGVPLHAPPLQFILQFNGIFQVELYCRYGNINMRTIRHIDEIKSQNGEQIKRYGYILNGMNIPRIVQRTFYDLCLNQLKLDEPTLNQLHRLAYIGGRVEQIQFLMNLYNFYSADIQPPPMELQ